MDLTLTEELASFERIIIRLLAHAVPSHSDHQADVATS